MIRCFDVLLAVFALSVLSPLLILTAVTLRFTGEREVFYIQRRIGRGQQPFGLIKFATMLKDSPNIGTGEITVAHDTRVLPVGRVLRKTKLNELPQLFNVLLGDMSLIGPRPLTPVNFQMYDEHVRSTVGSVLPGLSGVGSIVFRDEERFLGSHHEAREVYAEKISPYKGALECWYVENRSLSTYLMLILLTIDAVARPSSSLIFDIYKTMPKPNEDLAGFFGRTD